MAVLEKKLDKDKWAEMLKIEQEKKKAAKEAVDAHKAADLLIGSRKSNLNQPGESKAYTDDWKKEVDYTDPKNIPGEPELKQLPIPGLDLAHHLGDHFQDVPPQEILRRHMTGEQPLSPEDLERIFGPDYEELIQQQQQKQSLKISNPLIAMNPADVPLGDGLIKEALSGAQQANKEKYDLMYQEGWMSREEYIKQMKRTFGKEYEQYLVD